MTLASEKSHFTTRRAFIASAGFGVLGLYGLWAAYGAAPLTAFSHGAGGAHGDEATTAGAHAHGGHGAAADREEFRRLTEQFAQTYRLPDGSVQPGGAHRGHDDAPVDVYFAAYQWGFTPTVLRLQAQRPYRFQMMAVDVTHGAAVRIGPASRVVRLRSGVQVEQEWTFERPGEHLVYCTTYCGVLHDRMQGRIIVAAAA